MILVGGIWTSRTQNFWVLILSQGTSTCGAGDLKSRRHGTSTCWLGADTQKLWGVHWPLSALPHLNIRFKIDFWRIVRGAVLYLFFSGICPGIQSMNPQNKSQLGRDLTTPWLNPTGISFTCVADTFQCKVTSSNFHPEVKSIHALSGWQTEGPTAPPQLKLLLWLTPTLVAASAAPSTSA